MTARTTIGEPLMKNNSSSSPHPDKPVVLEEAVGISANPLPVPGTMRGGGMTINTLGRSGSLDFSGVVGGTTPSPKRRQVPGVPPHQPNKGSKDGDPLNDLTVTSSGNVSRSKERMSTGSATPRERSRSLKRTVTPSGADYGVVGSTSAGTFQQRQAIEDGRLAEGILGLGSVMSGEGIESDSDDDLAVADAGMRHTLKLMHRSRTPSRTKAVKMRRACMCEVLVTHLSFLRAADAAMKKARALAKLQHLMLPIVLRRSLAKAKHRRRYVSLSAGSRSGAASLEQEATELPEPPSADELQMKLPLFDRLNHWLVSKLSNEGMELVAYDDREIILKPGEIRYCLYYVARGGCTVLSSVASIGGNIDTASVSSLTSAAPGAGGGGRLPLAMTPPSSSTPGGGGSSKLRAGRASVRDSSNKVYRPGDMFGDVLGVPLSQKYCTVARGNTLLWRLTKERFDAIVAAEGNPQARTVIDEAFIERSESIIPEAFPMGMDLFRRTPVFKLWDEEILLSAAKEMIPRVYRQGEPIFVEGQQPSGVLIVLSGEIGLYRRAVVEPLDDPVVSPTSAPNNTSTNPSPPGAPLVEGKEKGKSGSTTGTGTGGRNNTTESSGPGGAKQHSKERKGTIPAGGSSSSGMGKGQPLTGGGRLGGAITAATAFKRPGGGRVKASAVGRVSYRVVSRGMLSEVLTSEDTVAALRTSDYQITGHRPYVILERQRYTQIVQSHLVQCWFVPDEVFGNLFTSNPEAFLAVRKQALDKRAKALPSLKVDQLSTIPLFQHIPPHRLEKIISSGLHPRVIERGATLVSSHEPVKEIYLIVSGDLKTGSGSNTRSLEETFFPSVKKTLAAAQQQVEQYLSEHGLPPTSAGREFATSASISDEGGAPMLELPITTPGAASNSQEQIPMDGSNSVAGVSVGGGAAALTNRPVVHLGGGFEGLLLGHWSDTWKATSVVELWVMSVAALRQEFTLLPKPLQHATLSAARHLQQQVLKLDHIATGPLPLLPHQKGRKKTMTMGEQAAGLQRSLKAFELSRRQRSTTSSVSDATSSALGTAGASASITSSIVATASQQQRKGRGERTPGETLLLPPRQKSAGSLYRSAGTGTSGGETGGENSVHSQTSTTSSSEPPVRPVSPKGDPWQAARYHREHRFSLSDRQLKAAGHRRPSATAREWVSGTATQHSSLPYSKRGPTHREEEDDEGLPSSSDLSYQRKKNKLFSAFEALANGTEKMEYTPAEQQRRKEKVMPMKELVVQKERAKRKERHQQHEWHQQIEARDGSRRSVSPYQWSQGIGVPEATDEHGILFGEGATDGGGVSPSHRRGRSPSPPMSPRPLVVPSLKEFDLWVRQGDVELAKHLEHGPPPTTRSARSVAPNRPPLPPAATARPPTSGGRPGTSGSIASTGGRQHASSVRGRARPKWPEPTAGGLALAVQENQQHHRRPGTGGTVTRSELSSASRGRGMETVAEEKHQIRQLVELFVTQQHSPPRVRPAPPRAEPNRDRYLMIADRATPPRWDTEQGAPSSSARALGPPRPTVPQHYRQYHQHRLHGEAVVDAAVGRMLEGA